MYEQTIWIFLDNASDFIWYFKVILCIVDTIGLGLLLQHF